MAHIVRDFFTGSLIIIIGTLATFVFFIAFLILGIFFKIFIVLASMSFFVFLVFFSIWLAGFLYRKLKERKQ